MLIAMAYIQAYQGNTTSLSVNLTNDDGTPFNASGYALWFSAKQTYSASSYLINSATTGVGANASAAVTGLMTIGLTTGDLNICPGIYPAQFTLTGGSPLSVNTIPTDGLEILPSFFTP